MMEDKILDNYEQRFQIISAEFSKEIENRKIFINSLDEKLAMALPGMKQEIIEELETGCLVMEDLSRKLEDSSEEFKE